MTISIRSVEKKFGLYPALNKIGLEIADGELLALMERWEALEAKGARKQRPLWASTGVKNPDYDDTMYVVDLVVASQADPSWRWTDILDFPDSLALGAGRPGWSHRAAGPGLRALGRDVRGQPDRGEYQAAPIKLNQPAGASAIIAVNLASATVLPLIAARPANLQTVARRWMNSTCKSIRQPGSTGARNLASSIAMK